MPHNFENRKQNFFFIIFCTQFVLRLSPSNARSLWFSNSLHYYVWSAQVVLLCLHAALAPKVRWQFVFVVLFGARELILYAKTVWESLIHTFYCNLYDFCVLPRLRLIRWMSVCVWGTSTRVVGLFMWASGVQMERAMEIGWNAYELEMPHAKYKYDVEVYWTFVWHCTCSSSQSAPNTHTNRVIGYLMTFSRRAWQ